MTCKIHWNTLSLAEWTVRFKRLRRSTLLQSCHYGMAMRSYRGQTPRWGLIEIAGQEAGLVQILEVKMLRGLVHALILDRGPLWFDGYGQTDHIRDFLAILQDEYPARWGRKRRLIPEIEDSVSNSNIFQTYNFRSRNAQPYQTLWLNLEQNEEALRAGLHKKWRNGLSKAERADITIEWDHTGQHLPWLLTAYHLDRTEKKYSGPSVPLLKALAKHCIPSGHMLIGRALQKDGEPIAGILILSHGQSATYQLGFTTNIGRGSNAHNLLLWQALNMLKCRDIKDFDLGGINDDADGIRKFKTGMGGQHVTLCGLYH